MRIRSPGAEFDKFAGDVEREIDRLDRAKPSHGSIIQLKAIFASDLPPATEWHNSRGVGLVFVSDAGVPAYSDGVNWRSVVDGSILA